MSNLHKRIASQRIASNHPGALDTHNLRRNSSFNSDFELDLDQLEEEFRDTSCSPLDFHDATPSTRALDDLCDELDWISPSTPTYQQLRAPPNTMLLPASAIQPDERAENHSAAPAEGAQFSRSAPAELLSRQLSAISPRLSAISPSSDLPIGCQADWSRVRRLGCGAAGETWLVQRAEDSAVCAMKEITKARLYSDDDMAEEAANWTGGMGGRGGKSNSSPARQATEEVELLAKMSHTHVVKYHGSIQSERSLNILMEYCSVGVGGDLQAVLRHHRTKRSRMLESTVIKWCHQLLMALAYIHSLCILHRDVKPANVFLTENEDIKLGDFGISRVLEAGSSLASTHCGTPCYYSPERCRGQQYGTPSDVWALGCILFECVALERPFKAESLHELVSSVLSKPTPSLPEGTSPMLKEVVDLALLKEPSKRGSVDALIRIASPSPHAPA